MGIRGCLFVSQGVRRADDMKSWGRFLLITAALGAFTAASPIANAQDASSVQSPQRFIPGVRYTTGAVTTAGWEKTLTDGDPNLKNWHWSAMTSYTQSCYNRVPPGAFLPKKNQPAQMQQIKQPGSIYTKPVHLSPETYAKKRTQPGVIVVGNGRADTSVSGRVRLPRQVAAVPAPAAKSYGVDYGVSGSLRTPQESYMASRSVHGRLMQ